MDSQRIVIVGKPGSGKTTLSRQLAQILSLQPVELDAIHWQPNWTPLDEANMLERVGEALPVDGHWVADGNYKMVRETVWGRADTFIWLDFGIIFTLSRLFRRTFGRVFFRKHLWNGNQEKLAHLLIPDKDENIFLFAIASHKRQREQYSLALRDERYGHLRVLRFRKASELDAWVESLTRSR
jgi:adenylate kinase family enzyme